ncbi:MAG: beta-glucosidase [Rhodobacteraceae bacterium]|nr:beta-glucosidase [Paracoccaceae bacterium]
MAPLPLFDRKDFPPGFTFGAATSAYQIEGSGFGSAGVSHWDSFAQGPGNVIRGENGARACDHFHRWAEDLDLVAGAGCSAYRFSLNWSRVQPDGRKTDPAGADFYDRLVDGMLARGIQPSATLYHWDLPSALAMRGGWCNPDIAWWFAEYAQAVQARIGDRLQSLATINEPWCVAWLSHYLGHHAPGLRDIRAAGHAMHNILAAHGHALSSLRAAGCRNAGIVLNFEPMFPLTDAADDHAATERSDAIFNRWFAEAITRGRYPEPAMDGLEPHLPTGWARDMPAISGKLDWLGVNYYTRSFHSAAPGLPWPHVATHSANPASPAATTDMGWDIYPRGLEETLLRVSRDLAPGLPLVVTENGAAFDDKMQNGRIDDADRIAFLADHLAATRRAIDAGVDVRGYYFWSLLDNFEWAMGFDKRFGLVHVDRESMKRTPKASYHALKSALIQE